MRQPADVKYMFTVYAIYNKERDKIYIGQTSDIDRRLKQHNGEIKFDDRLHYTTNLSGRWVIIYSEQVATRDAAMRRERQLKSHQGRTFIKSYIPG